MLARLDVHVEADKYDPSRPELNRQIERLKAAVLRRAEMTELVRQYPVNVRIDFHLLNVGVFRGRGGVLRDLDAAVSGQASVLLPPAPVAAIEHIGPRTQAPGLVDR